jgi:hypothetical protein
MSNWFTDLLGAGAGYYNQDKAAQAALELGEQSAEKLYGLGEDVAGRAEFKPFTVTTGLGGATTTPEGGYSLQMSPEQQALQNQLLGQSQALFGQVGVDPSTAQADLYEQIRATQRPEEERQRLALEERMLSQGRMGLSSSAYGGASPELLAQETARQEAMSRASLGARTQAMAEQKQALEAATGMMTQGYKPQEQALAALGYGMEGSKLALMGAGTGAELFGRLGQSGIEALMQGAELAQGLEAGKRQTLTEALLGREPTIQEQILANKYGVDLGDMGGMLTDGFDWLKDLFGSDDSGYEASEAELDAISNL